MLWLFQAVHEPNQMVTDTTSCPLPMQVQHSLLYMPQLSCNSHSHISPWELPLPKYQQF